MGAGQADHYLVDLLVKVVNRLAHMRMLVYTVEPPITDPPSYGHPPYNGRRVPIAIPI